jgi:hypothetical protein
MNYDKAYYQRHRAGKILKAEMAELAKKLFEKAGGVLWDTAAKQIAKAS